MEPRKGKKKKHCLFEIWRVHRWNQEKETDQPLVIGKALKWNQGKGNGKRMHFRNLKSSQMELGKGNRKNIAS